MNLALFDSETVYERQTQNLAPGAVVLHGFARDRDQELLDAVSEVIADAPFRHMVTPGGFRMSVAMTNCGSVGWVSERSGYRYDPIDPESGRPWPAMPEVFVNLANEAAAEAGFANYAPDVCLINRYEPGTKLSLHQDRDEQDKREPIVSVSLGLPAIFQFGGATRKERPQRIELLHGDVVVWGGPARLNYHGVMPLKDGSHPLTGPFRFNLTFRKAV
jgi:alkylated DNA repair protein (DNA oxidative demethylase)